MSYKDLHRKTFIAFLQTISLQHYAFKTMVRDTIFYHTFEHRLYHVVHDTWIGGECISHTLMLTRHPLTPSPITSL